MSRCTICKTGTMKKGTTTVAFDKNDTLIAFRHVPALVCDTCGDYVIDGTIAKSLLKTAREERSKGHQISILNYKKAA